MAAKGLLLLVMFTSALLYAWTCTQNSFAHRKSCAQKIIIYEGLDQLANDLRISGRKTSLTIKTINGEFTSNSTALEGLKIASISEDNNEWLTLPRTFSKPNLPVNDDDNTKPSQLIGYVGYIFASFCMPKREHL